ncbi:metallophosphoesterase [Clostridium butyricum]|uniref:Ser/Thr protein phosphatase family protein n=1 Tax=Clostridium butyricum E4 str. BoNT E BL5262 TaxID=632245 RepID=C4IJ44_CLOBU|nr:metallophosphoesterase [Clostridium butyricum]EDT75462.1 Ser/Thr protein phosphatase family protein [Clostridium butyricum 5521]EEP53481.1 Ser/Thr protein phosphatase family protein [Clostridium butyricum E4 str. BoNT E BL5262]NFL33104.1 serine/threonine protein phosphatase [Clostridium butyricum]NFS17107.1 serine/threonine protein phosphatase [Clostridium butyricum]
MDIKCRKSKELLSRLEKEGCVIDFDDTSKLVFISDVHRGNGGYEDSLRLNENIYKAALRYYYNNGYTLIEIGDGDELWKNKNILNIAYNYKDVFKMLNKFNHKKRLYLLYGNHDIIKSNPEFILKQKKVYNNIGDNFPSQMIDLYSKVKFYECAVLNYLPLNKNILAFHGHQVDTINCEFWKVSRFLVRYVWRFLEGVGGMKAPTSPATNYDKGDKIDKVLEKLAKKENRMIICGHTHNDKLPKPSEGLYCNDGCCVFPSAITTIEITNGKICLVKWKIEVDDQNSLYIKKSITAGPEKIGDYLEYN